MKNQIHSCVYVLFMNVYKHDRRKVTRMKNKFSETLFVPVKNTETGLKFLFDSRDKIRVYTSLDSLHKYLNPDMYDLILRYNIFNFD